MIPLLVLLLANLAFISSQSPVIHYCFYSNYSNCEPNVFGSNSSFDINKPDQGILKPLSEEDEGYNFTCTSSEPVRWLLSFQSADLIHSESDPPAPDLEGHLFTTNFQLKLHRHHPGSSNGVVKCVKLGNESDNAEVLVMERNPYAGQFAGSWDAIHFYLTKPKSLTNVVPCVSFGSPPISPVETKLLQRPRTDKISLEISDDCLNCICHPSCSTDDCRHDTCFPRWPFSFSEDFWKDGGYHNVSSAQCHNASSTFECLYEACLNDYNCTAVTIRKYLQKYQRDCNGDGVITCEDYIRIYRAGSRKCDTLEATERLTEQHQTCLQRVDATKNKELKVRQYDQRIGLIQAKPLTDFTSLFVCTTPDQDQDRNQSITYAPLSPGSQLKSNIQHDFIKMGNRNQSSVVCNVKGGDGMHMQLNIYACFKPTDCDLRYRPFNGFGEFSGEGDTVHVNTSVQPVVHQVIQELTVAQGLASCFGIQQEVPPNQKTPFAVSFAYFFTDLNGQIHFYPDTSTHLTATQSTSNSIQLNSTSTELYNGSEEDFTCRIATYLLSPKFQFGVAFEDGTVQWVPKAMTNTDIDVKNSDWDLSAIKFNNASTIATRTLRFTVRLDMKSVICKAPVTLSGEWMNATVAVHVHWNPKAFGSPILVLPIIAILVFLGLILYGLRERQQLRLKLKLRDLTEDEMALFYSGDTTEPSTLHGMLNVNKYGYPASYMLEKDRLNYFKEEELGMGHYGRCFKGFYQGRSVAVKATRSLMHVDTFLEFLKEVKLMAHVDQHDHIVKFIGAYVDDIEKRYCLVVMELSPYGNLRDYLGAYEQSAEGANETNQLLVTYETDFPSFAYQIAFAMDYVKSQNVIHGNLCARNVLVFEHGWVKVGNFGLSKDLWDKPYDELERNCKRPDLAWMALESITEGKYTYSSDIWSYGVTLWEIYKLGKVPYTEFRNNSKELVSYLEGGRRLEQPELASGEVFNYMQRCWCVEPKNRPTFAMAAAFFDSILSNDNGVDQEVLCNGAHDDQSVSVGLAEAINNSDGGAGGNGN